MSFHGIPKKSLMQGDPYHCECYKTARLLAEALKLKESEYMVSFQSRFGRAEWLKPYYAEVMADLGKKKEKNVHVVCPGFSSDCLETLEEINIEGRHIFLNHGGKSFSYIPALNDNPEWINAMQGIILENLQGWIDKSWTPKKEAQNSALTKKRALLIEKKQS
jgi:ferrochelatase